MKKEIYILVIILFCSFGNVYSQGFSPSAINWSLPAGGLIDNSVNSSYNSLANSGNGNTNGSQSWSILDMNGDGITDLVVLTERQAGTHNVFNLSGSPYWKVYLGGSSGFSSTAINWSLPAGGLILSSVNRSFDALSNPGNGDTNGSQSWSISDFNGDGIIDLVVFTERQAGSHSVFSVSSSPYWKVYLGSSTGFSSTAINWSLPAGGLILNSVNRSFNEFSNPGNGDTNGSQSWSTSDFNGDGKIDIMVLTQRVAGSHEVFGAASSRNWKFYAGTASGFSSTAINWSLPVGGLILNSVNRSFNELNNPGNGNTNGSQSWSTFDINGDEIPDLVVHTERQSGNHNVFNLSLNPYWKIYLGSASGFSTAAINWSLPSGGLILSSVNKSFNALTNPGNGDTNGSQSWSTIDITSDAIPDLVVLTERQSGSHSVFNLSVSPNWKVYAGTASGFSTTAINWSLPAGGYIDNSVSYSFNSLYTSYYGNTNGSQAWSVIDMNGDQQIDLLVYTERQAGSFDVFNLSSSPYWKLYVGSTPASTNEIITNNSSVFDVYPNPVSDVLTIKNNLHTNEKLKVSLTNILGQQQFEIEISNNESLNDFQIQMGNYSKGFYFLNIQTTNDNYTFKVQHQ